jgi:alkylation response protein AidB-like acyl-CoA dehydrogenase
VDGVLSVVPGGAGADLFVVAARTADGVDLFTVDAGPGVDAVALDSLDLARPSAMVTFTDAPATRLTAGGTADTVVPPALDIAAVALAAEQLGGAEACLELTVGYVKERRQFGRAIGSFQAVKHACADLLVQVETCRSAVVRAVAAEGSPEALAEAASVAQAWCSEAFRTVSAETVQLHGGIGFTWEHAAHLYFRRARADAVLLGGAAYHRERLARLLGW